MKDGRVKKRDARIDRVVNDLETGPTEQDALVKTKRLPRARSRISKVKTVHVHRTSRWFIKTAYGSHGEPVMVRARSKSGQVFNADIAGYNKWRVEYIQKGEKPNKSWIKGQKDVFRFAKAWMVFLETTLQAFDGKKVQLYITSESGNIVGAMIGTLEVDSTICTVSVKGGNFIRFTLEAQPIVICKSNNLYITLPL